MKRRLAAAAVLLAIPWSAALPAEPSVLVKTAAIEQRTLAETLTGYGTVTPDAGSTVDINLPRPGQVTRLYVSAGRRVRAGEPLLEFRTAAAAALGYREAESALTLAREDLKRTGQLVSEQLATQARLAAARKAVSDARAALEEQRRLGAGMSSERIPAPFDGLVVRLAAAQGDRLAAGAPVLQLARLGRLRVLLGIEPADSGNVRAGMPVRLVPVFDEGRSLQTVVEDVHGMIDPRTQLVDVAARVRRGELIPGTRVRGEIAIASVGTWAVPRSAVLRDSRGEYIFQVQGGRAKRIEVRTGPESGDFVAIRGEFDPALKVVVTGNYELKDGMAVRESG